MRNLIILLLTTLVISCSKTDKKSYALHSDKDINEIIKTIIIADSIPVTIVNPIGDTVHYKDRPDLIIHPVRFPFSVDLEKLRVCFPQPVKDAILTPPPPHGLAVYFNSVMERGLVNKTHTFSKADSAYFCYQNDTLLHFTFNDSIISKIYTTTLNKKTKKTLTSLVQYQFFPQTEKGLMLN